MADLLKLEYRSAQALVPYAKNARTHSDEQIAQIAKSIAKFGFTNPVLVDGNNGVIAGHGRLLAAAKLGIESVPVIELAGMTDAQRRAYIIADNKLALNAGWDTGILKLEMAEISELGEDLSITGFSEDEIARLMGDKSGLTDPDEVPENVEPTAKLGDVWVMGNHRLGCGDSTDPLVVDRVLNGVKPHLMVTDPPYGVDYDPEWRLKAGVNKPWQKRAEGKVENDDRYDWGEAWSLFPGEVAYVWHGALHSPAVAESLELCGFNIRSQIIWAKQTLVMGRGHYHWQHEPCWYVVKGTGHWSGDRKQSTLWQIQNMHRTQGNVDDGKTNHSTQKPVECMKRPIENNSSVGQAVYEPFSGSGTTIIAGEMTGRHVYAIELNPAYVDIAVKRWENFTGQKAILDGKPDEHSGPEVGQAMASSDHAGRQPRGKRRQDKASGDPGTAAD